MMNLSEGLRKATPTMILAAVVLAGGAAWAAFQVVTSVNGSLTTTDLALEPSSASAVASAGSCEVSMNPDAAIQAF